MVFRRTDVVNNTEKYCKLNKTELDNTFINAENKLLDSNRIKFKNVKIVEMTTY